ncbi:SID1 transmembrane family member 1-like isoform X2 [Aricia agestis]|uniref:SID1 transmembrane family member 1-like isoform X2 n=1 Tax=Aricia agestis TaxID=91739 RepID=UPI001C203CC7|nr:SID1 transmembrane family member 1-like isoform X2 [Aricia agestis]
MWLSFNEVHVLPLNSSVEYILQFKSPDSNNLQPSVLWAHTTAGDDTHPVLITVRQRSGALTWQLPYRSEGQELNELERTLCPDDTAERRGDDDGCVHEWGSFSLHVSTSCTSTSLSVRASQATTWHITIDTPLTVAATLWSPRTLHYRFGADASDVRLVISSETDICATVIVQNYTCPVVQNVQDTSIGMMRMTMVRSAAVQISRDTYPNGVYVTMIVMRADEECSGEVEVDSDWLYETAVFISTGTAARSVSQRQKTFNITVQKALSRAQYLWAAGATIALFALFYALVGALVLAQRWPPFAKYVLPRAVLADQTDDVAVEDARPGSEAQATRRRRDSVATYDSSDNSDSDSEYESATPSRADRSSPNDVTGHTSVQENGGIYIDTTYDTSAPGRDDTGTESQRQGPFGLPARLHLAALARRGHRTLRARSDRYLYMLATVAVFYALPVVQFVIAFQVVMNVSGSLDICYYNFLCAHRLGALSDFNHVLSNLGYLLLGALFLLQVRRRRSRRKRQPRHEEYGIPAHYGLLSALGLGMIVVALLSASYHVCPNRLNFQFDTAFMYVLAVLIMVKIYQTRHPDVNARAHATFAVLAVLIALVVWGVLGGGPVFWGVFTLLHIFTFLLLSLRIYYLGQVRLEKQSLTLAAAELRKDLRPLYGARMVMLVIGNALNWSFAFYGLVTQSSDFAGHLLTVLLGNALVYMVFYLAMKLVHGERLRWYAWALLAAAAASWVPALYFFVSGSSDWSTTPALSRHYNHECKVLQFYDSHDLWHILSAIALYLSFSAILTWDDGLSAVKRTDIPVF